MEDSKSTYLMIRSDIKSPIFDEFDFADWTGELIDKLGMKPILGPIAKHTKKPGNEGLTALAAMEGSHIACNVWYGCVPAILQMDLYTSETVIETIIFDHLHIMHPENMQFKYVDRVLGLTTVSAGVIFNR